MVIFEPEGFSDELKEQLKSKGYIINEERTPIIGKVDVDHNPDTAAKYGIRSIPTIVLIKNGQVVDRQVGAVSKAVLKQKIDAHL